MVVDNAKIKLPNIPNDSTFTGSELITKLKPTSVFNDYPFEVAVVVQNNKTNKITNFTNIAHNISKFKGDKYEDMLKVKPLPLRANSGNLIYEEFKKYNKTNLNNEIVNDKDVLSDNTIEKKRSMNDKLPEHDIVKKIVFNEPINKTTENSKISRNIFDKDLPAWQQNTLLDMIPENKYFQENHLIVMPKSEELKTAQKSISESGLVKVLEMLTKAFRKIMKQHEFIDRAYSNIKTIHEEFKKVHSEVNKKLNDFNLKSNILMQYQEKLRLMEENFYKKEQSFIKKQKQFSDNLTELEKQQSKFQSQQHQFYNIQKLMLAQNEKVANSQHSIAKTQYEISLRQSNISDVLNKIKYFDTKHKTVTNYMVKVTTAEPEIMKTTKKPTTTTTKPTTTTTPLPVTTVTNSMKIDLLSFPKQINVESNDKNLLNEKDFNAIDYIVYKYYFNNTYIDNLIKSRILNGFAFNNFDSKRNAKIKRFDTNNNKVFKSTLLLPVNISENHTNEIKINKILTRNRRWVNYHPKRKYKRKSRRDVINPLKKVEDKKNITEIKNNNIIENLDYDTNQFIEKENIVDDQMEKADPFSKMAKNFCKEIGQDNNEKSFSWCIQKTMRKLRVPSE